MTNTIAQRARLKLMPKGADLRRQADIVETMLGEGERLLDRHVLLGHLKAFGLSGYTSLWKDLAHLSDWQNKSVVGPMQIPTSLSTTFSTPDAFDRHPSPRSALRMVEPRCSRLHSFRR
jgi:hypothetical protein